MKTRYILRSSRRFALLILVFVASNSAYAIGLGKIQVKSSLNQPLSAQIPIYRNGGETALGAENITVGLGSPDAHHTSGIVYSSLIQDLKFSVLEESNGQLILQIHSRIAVYEPILSFLVSISSSAGRLTKEYSIILDPEEYRSPTRIATAPVSSSLFEPPKRTVKRTTKRRKITISGTSYTVKTGDSLSKIAIAASKNSGMDYREYMRLIYANNPDAFQGSMDLLLANVSLSIPAPEDFIVKNDLAQTAELPESGTSTTTKTSVTNDTTETSGPRLQLLPPDPDGIDVKTTEDPRQASSGNNQSVTIPDSVSLKSMREISELKEQLALMQGKNDALESTLETANDNLTQIRLDIQNLAKLQQQNQTASAGSNKSRNWLDWLPFLLAALSFLLFLSLVLRKKDSKSQNANTNTPRIITTVDQTASDYIHEQVDVPTFTDEDINTLKDIGDVPAIKDDLVASQEQNLPTIQINPGDAATQTFMSSFDDPNIEATQNLNAAQEAEIYLAYQQFKLAKKTIDRLLEEEPDNYKYKILHLQLLAKTAEMDELQGLSVELFKQFPDRNDEVHQRIQEICDMAFTANQQSISPPQDLPSDSIDITTEMDQIDLTAEMEDSTQTRQQQLEDTLMLNNDITEFLSEDLTLSTTDPTLKQDEVLDSSDLPLNHTDLLEPDPTQLEQLDKAYTEHQEYDEISSEVTELLDDLTEEELELPFDLETEIIQEEEKTKLLEEYDEDEPPDQKD